jgi:ubiquinone/menaquinone biosynthesis C-methylase UbiE
MKDYYQEKLAAEKLLKVYEIAPPRVQQYLNSELDFVLQKISAEDLVLDLGCGYGRIIPQLAQKAKFVVGIDTSCTSLVMGKKMLTGISNFQLAQMNAINLGFSENSFDVVICIQNGISAFHVDPKELVRESIRVAKPGGTVLFSTYSVKYWNHRLHWFQLQAEAGLLGEIDYEKTGNGVIVCKDGFMATTVSPEQFLELTRKFDVQATIVELDESSVFCEIRKDIPQ